MDYVLPNIRLFSDEFLKWMTKIHAQQVYSDTLNPKHDENWFVGEKIVAVVITDTLRSSCRNTNECQPLPKCCRKYIDKINIEELKNYKAHFTWKYKDGNRSYDEVKAKCHYYEACDDIFNVFLTCNQFRHQYKLDKCTYAKILTMMDRRKNKRDRRQREEEIEFPDRRLGNRRKNDLNGCLEQYL